MSSKPKPYTEAEIVYRRKFPNVSPHHSDEASRWREERDRWLATLDAERAKREEAERERDEALALLGEARKSLRRVLRLARKVQGCNPKEHNRVLALRGTADRGQARITAALARNKHDEGVVPPEKLGCREATEDAPPSSAPSTNKEPSGPSGDCGEPAGPDEDRAELDQPSARAESAQSAGASPHERNPGGSASPPERCPTCLNLRKDGRGTIKKRLVSDVGQPRSRKFNVYRCPDPFHAQPEQDRLTARQHVPLDQPTPADRQGEGGRAP